MLAVGATGNTSAKAHYSNYGSLYTDVRLHSLHSSSLSQFIAPRLRLSRVDRAIKFHCRRWWRPAATLPF